MSCAVKWMLNKKYIIMQFVAGIIFNVLKYIIYIYKIQYHPSEII